MFGGAGLKSGAGQRSPVNNGWANADARVLLEDPLSIDHELMNATTAPELAYLDDELTNGRNKMQSFANKRSGLGRGNWATQFRDMIITKFREMGKQRQVANTFCGAGLPGARTDFGDTKPPVPYRCFLLMFLALWVVMCFYLALDNYYLSNGEGSGSSGRSSSAVSGTATSTSTSAGAGDTTTTTTRNLKEQDESGTINSENMAAKKIPKDKGAPLFATPPARLERVSVPSTWTHATYLQELRSRMGSLWERVSAKGNDPVAHAAMLDSLWLMDLNVLWDDGREILRKIAKIGEGQAGASVSASGEDSVVTMAGNDYRVPATWGSEQRTSFADIPDTLSGLVAAYGLSGHKFAYHLAKDFASRAVKLFQTSTGFPAVEITMQDGKPTTETRSESFSITEIGEHGLPFLSAGLLLHGSAAQSSEEWARVLYPLAGLTDIHEAEHHLLPSLFHVPTPDSRLKWRTNLNPFFGESSRTVIRWTRNDLKTVDVYSFGYYEFLLKGHLMLREAWSGSALPYTWGQLFQQSMEEIMRERIRFGSDKAALLVNARETMTAVSCPFAGLLALGSRSFGASSGASSGAEDYSHWLEAAAGVGETCHRMLKAGCANTARLSATKEVTIAKPKQTGATKLGMKKNPRDVDVNPDEKVNKNSTSCANFGAQNAYLLAGSYYELWRSTGNPKWQRFVRDVLEYLPGEVSAPLLRFAYFAHAPPQLDAFLKTAILTREGHPLRAPDVASSLDTIQVGGTLRGAKNTTAAARGSGKTKAVFDQKITQPESDREAEEARSYTDEQNRRPLSRYKVNGQPVRVGPSVFKKMRFRPSRTFPVEQLFASGRHKFMNDAYVKAASNFVDIAEDWNAPKKWDLNYITDEKYVASLQPATTGNKKRRSTRVTPGPKPSTAKFAVA
ncbi:unnamed protein product [Amoebophrya sp. A25]|nr:unnamed protein product [Amoebophrya sp. A25]|eukprot:GSA25T00020269001.1